MMRVANRQMYSNIVTRMNGTLSQLMESNIQAASEKRINKPSDDPFGTAQVLNGRATQASLKQYTNNIGTAKGWLNAADGALGSMHEVLTRLYVLAEQSATGSLTDAQRTDVSFEARGLFEQLISLSNTEFNGRHIFSGHKTDQSAYVAGLGVSCTDNGMSNVSYQVEGGLATAAIIQFTEDATITGDGPTGKDITINPPQPTFRYSLDGGKTWADGTWDTTTPPGTPRMLAGGASVMMQVPMGQTATITALKDPDSPNQSENGTWLFVRPAAIYQGDDNDTQVVQNYFSLASFNASKGGSMTATGIFTRDVAVRINGSDGNVPPTYDYSYSLDDGANWKSATAVGNGSGGVSLPIPGGYVTLDNADPDAGDQFIVHPRRANINLTIGEDASIVTNIIGKDAFGGLYAAPFTTEGAQPVYGGSGKNMFETVGRFVGYLETNNQDGCQRALDELKEAMTNVVTYRTSVGGRLNRLEVAKEQAENLNYDVADQLSRVEDVDVTELMTRLSQQQLAYSAVLKSSSMIMQMSLMNFL